MSASYKLPGSMLHQGPASPSAPARRDSPQQSRLLSSALDGAVPAPSWTPPRETMHLTIAQQKTLMNALRRSGKIVA